MITAQQPGSLPSTPIATQSFRTTLNIVNITLGLAFLAVLLVGLSGVVWLLSGHTSAISFHTPADWGLAWNPNGYYSLALFAFITQAYLGIEVPLNMGSEMHQGNKRCISIVCVCILISYVVTYENFLTWRSIKLSSNLGGLHAWST